MFWSSWEKASQLAISNFIPNTVKNIFTYSCCKILEPKGLDLMKLLTDPDPAIFSNILHSFVAIAAVQIGLTDLLSSFGIKPNNIIGKVFTVLDNILI